MKILSLFFVTLLASSNRSSNDDSSYSTVETNHKYSPFTCNLPFEIFQEIARFSSIKTLLALSQTSTRIRDALNNILHELEQLKATSYMQAGSNYIVIRQLERDMDDINDFITRNSGVQFMFRGLSTYFYVKSNFVFQCPDTITVKDSSSSYLNMALKDENDPHFDFLEDSFPPEFLCLPLIMKRKFFPQQKNYNLRGSSRFRCLGDL